ncbi:uncharacterized protein F5147DRAFT_670083 [Suillus discolor]|uniref:Uncharacterized protein n=1 Tax=Suillus discolor TaxID=1912936 RepID=A0A9P7FIM2_9AGAM|nr:uncharacterized protein F5147DRAFT_670083 [Suillus discolor]KAG2118136.1 hypothetical protein F5147DRAFT_670083 [Suillus discolor]
MQLTLIFTTLVTFAAIAASHPTPKLVKARISLDKPQELNPSTIDYDYGLINIASAIKLDTPDSVDFGDTPASSRRSLNSVASGEADHNETPTSLAGRQEPVVIDWDYSVLKMPKVLESELTPTSRDGVHKALTPDKPDTLMSPRRSLDSDASGEANHNDVHKRKAFVYRLKDEKRYN